jgi:hypothetical protein
MTALLVGAAIGLLAACVIGGYRIHRAIADRQLVDLEDAIPKYVDRTRGVWPPIVVDLDSFIDAIDDLVREQRLEDSAPWN